MLCDGYFFLGGGTVHTQLRYLTSKLTTEIRDKLLLSARPCFGQNQKKLTKINTIHVNYT